MGVFRLQVCGAKVLVFSISLTCIPWLTVEMWPKSLCHTHVEYRSPQSLRWDSQFCHRCSGRSTRWLQATALQAPATQNTSLTQALVGNAGPQASQICGYQLASPRVTKWLRSTLRSDEPGVTILRDGFWSLTANQPSRQQAVIKSGHLTHWAPSVRHRFLSCHFVMRWCYHPGHRESKGLGWEPCTTGSYVQIWTKTQISKQDCSTVSQIFLCDDCGNYVTGCFLESSHYAEHLAPITPFCFVQP